MITDANSDRGSSCPKLLNIRLKTSVLGYFPRRIGYDPNIAFHRRFDNRALNG
jgi:hypothetical protein